MKKKHPSGHQGRERRRERAVDELRAKAALLGVQIVDPSAPSSDGDAIVAAFASLGDPPLDDPSTALRWVRQVQLVALQVAVTSAELPLRDKLRFAKDISASAGMTFARAELEERIVRVEKILDGYRAPSSIVLASCENVTRPPGARGGSRTRRPQPVESLPPKDGNDDDDKGPN